MPATRGLFNADAFGKMKKGAVAHQHRARTAGG